MFTLIKLYSKTSFKTIQDVVKRYFCYSTAVLLLFFSYCKIALSQSQPIGQVDVSSSPSAEKNSISSTGVVKDPKIGNKKLERPLVEGKAGISLFTEDTYSGKAGANKPQNSYAKGYVLGNLYFTQDFYLSTNIRFQSSKGDSTVGNYYFDDGSAFIADLTLRYDADNYSLVGGHASINYSLSRDYMAGLWGKTYAKKEYGVDGMMVLGGSYKFNTATYGNHAISATAFMVDNTWLSNTFGDTKDPTPLWMGGPANTGKFNNFAFALDGLNIKAIPKFRYQIATVRLTTESLYNSSTNSQVSPQYLANEQRYVAAGMFNKLDIGFGIKLSPLLEYNRVLNSSGISGYNKSYYVGSLLFGYKKWNLGLSGSVWDADWSTLSSEIKKFIPSNNYISDRWNQMQAAIGYSFDNGIKATIAYKKENQYIGTTSQTVGINLKYDLPFAF